MSSNNHRGVLFTSESVTEGHPDKIADQISDAVLDAVLAQDPMGRVACETLLTTGMVILAGEITTTALVDYAEVARETVREIGYDRAKYGFDCDTCSVLSAVHRQSPDQQMKFLFDRSSAGCKCRERQADAQILQASSKISAERS